MLRTASMPGGKFKKIKKPIIMCQPTSGDLLFMDAATTNVAAM
jgi:hypothetical protein